MRGVELTPDRPVAEVASLGAAAEDAGFDAVLASCHYNNRDAFVALDRIAAATGTVRLGPGVVNPYETHPVALASRVATLAEVTGGRVVCGLGAGDRSTLANLGVERERPLRRVLETMRVARRLWDGERVDHDGTFVARDAGLNYGAGPIPIYVGAQGPDMLRMAATYADGALINASHPTDAAWAADRLAEGSGDRPPERGPFEAVAHVSASVADDAAAAREAARPPVAFIAAGAPRAVLDRHGIDVGPATTIGEHLSAGAYAEAVDAVTDRMLDAFCVAGTPATVAERFGALLDHVDGLVAGAPLGPDRRAAIDLLAAAFDRVDGE